MRNSDLFRFFTVDIRNSELTGNPTAMLSSDSLLVPA